MCEAFTCTPGEAEEQDEELVMDVLFARAARQAVRTFNDPKQTMSEGETKVMDALLGALDERDEALGIEPEE